MRVTFDSLKDGQEFVLTATGVKYVKVPFSTRFFRTINARKLDNPTRGTYITPIA